MKPRLHTIWLPLWRRLAAALALLAMAFAATVSTAAHSLAMAPQAMHDHAAMQEHTDAAPAEMPAGAAADCDQGCILCKTCSLCTMLSVAPPVAGALPPPPLKSGLLALIEPPSHNPDLPAEPPRF